MQLGCVSSLSQVSWKSAAVRVKLLLMLCGCWLVPGCGRVELLGIAVLSGGIDHQRLNISSTPIANKYREGKMQRTLKRELKSTWNCWKGSEGNEWESSCVSWSTLWARIVAATSQCWHGWSNFPLQQLWCFGIIVCGFLFCLCQGVSQSARDTDEIVFFSPSWNTDQGVKHVREY